MVPTLANQPMSKLPPGPDRTCRICKTLLRSAVVALGLMLGHAAWVAVALNASNQAMSLHVAYFDTDAEVIAPIVSDDPRSLLEQAGGLWTDQVFLYAAIAWSPVWLIARFVAMTILTFAIWTVAIWIVRLIACRGPGQLGSAIDLTLSERSAPPWLAPALSPAFAFIAAVALAFAHKLASLYASLPSPAAYPWASPMEHVGWTVVSAFSVSLSLLWARRTVRLSRARQALAHAERLVCSRCAYDLENLTTTRCPECGAEPPSPPRYRLGRPILAAAILLPVVAVIAGVAATGAIPNLVSYALDKNVFVVREGNHVTLPLRRPVVVHGEWGAVYFIAAPVDSTGQTIIRAVHIPNHAGVSTQIVTHLIDAQGPSTLPFTNISLAGVQPLNESGLGAMVRNRSFADPTTRFVMISRFAQRPKRITALPRAHDSIPEPIREILNSTFPDEQTARQLIENTITEALQSTHGQEP